MNERLHDMTSHGVFLGVSLSQKKNKNKNKKQKTKNRFGCRQVGVFRPTF